MESIAGYLQNQPNNYGCCVATTASVGAGYGSSDSPRQRRHAWYKPYTNVRKKTVKPLVAAYSANCVVICLLGNEVLRATNPFQTWVAQLSACTKTLFLHCIGEFSRKGVYEPSGCVPVVGGCGKEFDHADLGNL